jgi:hypothetical protein
MGDYITNELLLKYDQKFNENYNNIIHLNSSIMNKEELILKINDEISNKNNSITILKFTIYLIILIGILFILRSIGKITNGNFILYSICLFIAYLIFIYYNIYSTFNSINAEKIIKNLNVDMKNFVYTIVNDIDDLKCPSTCNQISNNPPSTNTIQTYTTPTLNIDSQANVWKYGDVPSDGFTSPNTPGSAFYSSPTNIPYYRVTNEEINENEPKPFFGTTYPKTTYYKCEWSGGNLNYGLPNSEPTYSTIPCSYRENYIEKERYICSKDPNKEGNLNSCTSNLL